MSCCFKGLRADIFFSSAVNGHGGGRNGRWNWTSHAYACDSESAVWGQQFLSIKGFDIPSCMFPLIVALVSVAMFDGKSLTGWKETPFSGHAEVRVENGTLLLAPGKPMTGITWTGEFPRSNYEVRYEAMRGQGNDFFASLTFPVG